MFHLCYTTAQHSDDFLTKEKEKFFFLSSDSLNQASSLVDAVTSNMVQPTIQIPTLTYPSTTAILDPSISGRLAQLAKTLPDHHPTP